MSPSLNNFAVNRISKGVSGSKGIRQSGGARGGTRAGQRAFTLIELLAVIAIIALLAGIVLTTAGTAIANTDFIPVSSRCWCGRPCAGRAVAW